MRNLTRFVCAALLLAACSEDDGVGTGEQAVEYTTAGDTAVRCSNWSWWDPVWQPDPWTCFNYCSAYGADACEWYVSGDCYVEFGTDCYLAPGYDGWWGAIEQAPSPPPAPPQACASFVAGSGNAYADWVYLGSMTKDSCSCACAGYECCDWNDNGDCYGEWGNCTQVPGYPGWHSIGTAPLQPPGGPGPAAGTHTCYSENGPYWCNLVEATDTWGCDFITNDAFDLDATEATVCCETHDSCYAAHNCSASPARWASAALVAIADNPALTDAIKKAIDLIPGTSQAIQPWLEGALCAVSWYQTLNYDECLACDVQAIKCITTTYEWDAGFHPPPPSYGSCSDYRAEGGFVGPWEFNPYGNNVCDLPRNANNRFGCVDDRFCPAGYHCNVDSGQCWGGSPASLRPTPAPPFPDTNWSLVSGFGAACSGVSFTCDFVSSNGQCCVNLPVVGTFCTDAQPNPNPNPTPTPDPEAWCGCLGENIPAESWSWELCNACQFPSCFDECYNNGGWCTDCEAQCGSNGCASGTCDSMGFGCWDGSAGACWDNCYEDGWGSCWECGWECNYMGCALGCNASSGYCLEDEGGM
jgi:hypothetical protein